MNPDEGAQQAHPTAADLQQGRVPILSTLLMAAVAIGIGVAGLTGCTDGLSHAAEHSARGVGPDPALPTPQISQIPTVNIAAAAGWSGQARPQTAPGTRVHPFATRLDHPRWLYVLPDGDVRVAETHAPPKSERSAGRLKGHVTGLATGLVMARAGAGTPSALPVEL